MKALKSIVLIFFITVSMKGFAQFQTPPKPAENKVFDAMVGEWTGEGDMMGMKFNETLKFNWNLNHQFMFMELKAVGER